jgi:uncharacterized repeat protein (TIGR01451 family)
VQALGVDLRLSHSAPTFVELGGTYVLRVTVTNAGPATATSVRVTEQLQGAGIPAGLRFVSAPAACAGSPSSPTVVCTAPSLAPGRSAIFDLTLKPWLTCTLIGTTGDNEITGSPQADVICGGGGNDTINGAAGNDTIYGYGPTGHVVTAAGSATSAEREDGPGNETASTTTDIAGPGFPTSDRDKISGGSGNDRIEGQNGADKLDGNDGADGVLGGPGDDDLDGGDGGDRLEGHGGVDSLAGQKGNDTLHGGQDGGSQVDDGGNTLDGGPGTDFCSRGEGAGDKLKKCELP